MYETEYYNILSLKPVPCQVINFKELGRGKFSMQRSSLNVMHPH